MTVIAPVDLNPSRPSAQECWKTSVSTPYAAPTESMFSTIAVSGITIDRNVISSSRNVIVNTNANTTGRWDFIESLKSLAPAVSPATSALTPGTAADRGRDHLIRAGCPARGTRPSRCPVR